VDETLARPYIDRQVTLPMPAHNNGGLDTAAQRLIVVRLLEDHARPVSREELHTARPDIGADRLDAAVDSLAEAQVVQADGLQVSSTPALKRLDDLQLVAI
jgi:hypothetical protein